MSEPTTLFEEQPGAFWERAVLHRLVTGGEVDLAEVPVQVSALLANRDALSAAVQRLVAGLESRDVHIADTGQGRERDAVRAALAEIDELERDVNESACGHHHDPDRREVLTLASRQFAPVSIEDAHAVGDVVLFLAGRYRTWLRCDHAASGGDDDAG